jgi:hypothetical protein
MAYHLSNLSHFLPTGFHHLHVPSRKLMARACTCRAPRLHEDWAIVTVNQLPLNEMVFANVREVIHEFLVHRRHVRIRDIQKSHLGQALIRFEHIYDRDNFVAQSSHPYGDVTFSFTKHDEGRN